MKRAFLIGGGVAVFVLIIIIVATVISKGEESLPDFSSSYFTSCDNPARISELKSFPSAAVSTDAIPCAEIAIDILKRNGTAADASIAGMFCVGIINAQSSGLGGGFVATYYSTKEGKSYCLDARETAPIAAIPDMYNPDLSPFLKEKKDKWYEKKPSASMKGGLSVAVPGESAGLYELYKKFGGGVAWSELIEPSIKLCEEGYELTWYTGGIMYPMRNDILAEPTMSILMNTTEKRILHEGEKVFRIKLAETLRTLQREPDALYNGSLRQPFVEDLQEFGGIITEQDLENYRPVWRKPVTFHLKNGNIKLHSFPPPGSGLVLGLILNILDEFNLTESSLNSEELFQTHQRVTEAFKFGYAQRYRIGDISEEEQEELQSLLASEEFAEEIKSKISDTKTNQDPLYYGTQIVPEKDVGTAHFSLIAPNGDAVAITSSINYAYGAGIRSESTGIIYNNQMADFSTDKSNSKPRSMKMERNTIRPGKRPLSSMSPSVFVDEADDVKLVLGGAGGIRIPSAEAWVAIRYLWMGQDLKSAIDSCRSHHQLIPMSLQYETGFPKSVLEDLEKKGHSINEYTWKSVVNAVAKERGSIVGNADYRKSGEVAGF